MYLFVFIEKQQKQQKKKVKCNKQTKENFVLFL